MELIRLHITEEKITEFEDMGEIQQRENSLKKWRASGAIEQLQVAKYALSKSS